MISKFAKVRFIVACAAWAATSLAWAADTSIVPVTINVQPMASISFPAGASIHLTVPPPNSTLPAAGVLFSVTGNGKASVTAAPHQYLFVNPYILGPNAFPGQWLGKATHGAGHEIGYNLAIEFPVFTSPQWLPGTNGGSTAANPVTVSTTTPVQGFLHMNASHRWTEDASMPAVGDYHGNIIVTVAASP